MHLSLLSFKAKINLNGFKRQPTKTYLICVKTILINHVIYNNTRVYDSITLCNCMFIRL